MDFGLFKVWAVRLATVFAVSALASEAPYSISIPPLTREASLRMGYEIHCDHEHSPLLHMIEANFQGEPETFRLPIFRNLHTADLPLVSSRDPREILIHPRMRKGCRLEIRNEELV